MFNLKVTLCMNGDASRSFASNNVFIFDNSVISVNCSIVYHNYVVQLVMYLMYVCCPLVVKVEASFHEHVSWVVYAVGSCSWSKLHHVQLNDALS
jgi:hypothetical protein